MKKTYNKGLCKMCPNYKNYLGHYLEDNSPLCVYWVWDFRKDIKTGKCILKKEAKNGEKQKAGSKEVRV